jgi:hypothetical protein
VGHETPGGSRRRKRAVISRPCKIKEIAALPSGHVGVYRADDGKRWEAYVMERDLVRLGVFASKRAAVAARAQYWKAKDRGVP